MKRILVLRHAKSSWKADDLPDHERPLNGRGRKDAPRVGRWIARQRLVPGRVLASTAVRAQTTARLVAAEFGDDACEVELRPDLYLSGPDAYVRALAGLSDDVECAMVVGHNPDVEELVLLLTGRGVSLPTGSLALIEAGTALWATLDSVVPGTQGRLEGLWTPKELPDDPD